LLQKIQEWAYTLLVVAICLLALIGVLLFAWHFEDATPWRRMSAGEWGVWVGSIGTVGALIGTIWLATEDRREARKHAQDRAVLASAALTIRLSLLADELQSAVESLLDYATTKTAAEYKGHAKTIEDAGTWSDEELLPLIVLPHHVASRLASVRSVIEQAIIDMRFISQNYLYSWMQDTLDERRGKLAASLVIARDTVQFAADECKRTVKDAVRS